MRVLIIPAGPLEWASARLRAYWLAKYWPEAHVYQRGESADLRDYDAVIVQKVVAPPVMQLAELVKQHGLKLAFDTVDPMWWWQPAEHEHMAGLADVVVASNDGLAAQWEQDMHTPCQVVPDRHDPEFHPTEKQHAQADVTRFIWFGNGGNRWTLNAAAAYLNRLAAMGHKIALDIVDEGPPAGPLTDAFEVRWRKWDLATFHDCLLEADVALLPPFPGAWGTCKSNNKTTTAWWAGLPVVDGEKWNDGLLAMDADYRAEVGRKNREKAEKGYDVRVSVSEWKGLLA